jgi:hypothetical protein
VSELFAAILNASTGDAGAEAGREDGGAAGPVAA